MSPKRGEDDQMSKARKSLPPHAARIAAALALFGFMGAILGVSGGTAKAESYPYYYHQPLYAPYQPHRAYTGYFFAASNFCEPDLNLIDGGFATPAYDGGVFVGYVCR
jgi:hypothetical protein